MIPKCQTVPHLMFCEFTETILRSFKEITQNKEQILP